MLSRKENEANSLTAFRWNAQDREIRSLKLNDEPWFVAKDVCASLGIENNSQAISRLDDDEVRGSLVMTPSGQQTMKLVNESGLYNLIFQSRKPEARAFRKWVTGEVLPTLRRTGTYGVAQPAPLAVPVVVDARGYQLQVERLAEGFVVTCWHEGRRLWAVTQVLRAIGSKTTTGQVVKRVLEPGGAVLVRLRVVGLTGPAYFTDQQGLTLLLHSSRAAAAKTVLHVHAAAGSQITLNFSTAK